MPDISVYPSGHISLRVSVVKALGLSKGDLIDVLTDGTEFYIYKRMTAECASGHHRGRLFPTSPLSRHLRTYAPPLARALCGGLLPDAVVRFAVGAPIEIKEHTTLPIITALTFD